MMHFLHHLSTLETFFSYKKIRNFLQLTLLFFIFPWTLIADESKWEVLHAKIYIENDLLSETDSQYTGGTKIDVLYKVNNPTSSLYNLLFVDDSKSYSFVSFAVGSQLYTPADLSKTEPIYDDWSYAAWAYVESGIHKSTAKTLSSLVLKVGMVGPSAKGEQIQKTIHKWTGSEIPQGWDNQLYDELGINIGYMHKRRYEYKKSNSNYGIVLIPTLSVDLGNISTQASVGLLSRIGYNIAKDFGVTTISAGAESDIPSYTKKKRSHANHWSYSLNIAARVSAVAKDIFVEGNTFKTSIVTHERENLVAYYGAGISVRYKSFIIDFMQIHNTPRAKDIDESQTVGSLIITYLF